MPKRTSKEFDRFTTLVNRLLAVPHAECAKELDALWSSSASGPAPQVHVRGEWNSDQWNTCSCGVIDCPDARPAQGEEPR